MRIKPGKSYYDHEGFIWRVVTRKQFHEEFEAKYGHPIGGENAEIGKDQYYAINNDEYHMGFSFMVYYKNGKAYQDTDDEIDLFCEVNNKPKKRQKGIQAKHIPTIGILRMIEFYHGNEELVMSPYESLKYFGYNENILMAKLEKLERKGYIDCGMTITHPWLTEKGKEYLKRLENG